MSERYAWEDTKGGKAFLRNPQRASLALRAKCLDCCCGQVSEVRHCLDEELVERCPIYLHYKARKAKRGRDKSSNLAAIADKVQPVADNAKRIGKQGARIR